MVLKTWHTVLSLPPCLVLYLFGPRTLRSVSPLRARSAYPLCEISLKMFLEVTFLDQELYLLIVLVSFLSVVPLDFVEPIPSARLRPYDI